MALINPAGLYTGGAVNLNPLPYMQMEERARARKAAKDEAIDKYYGNLPNTLNDKGVRDIEIPIISGAKDKIQQYWIQNRDAIKKGNTPEAQNYGKMFRELGGVVQESKNRAKTDLELGKKRMEGKDGYIFDDKGFMTKKSKHDLPVTDPESRSIDIAADFVGTKPFDNNEIKKELTDVKFSFGTPKREPHPTDKFSIVETPVPILSDDAKAEVYSRAVNRYYDDPSFKKRIEDDLAGTGRLEKLRSKFKETYGKNIDSDPEIAVAYYLDYLSPAIIKPKSSANVEEINAAKNAEWDRRNEKVFGQSVAKIRLNKANGSGTYEIDNVPEMLRNNAQEVETGWGLLGGKKKDKLVDITYLPEGYRNDIFGVEKDRRGNQKNKGIIIDGKEYLKPLPNGQFMGADNYIVTDKDIINSTGKRTTTYMEKPIGTGKATVRGGQKETTPKSKGKFDNL